MQPGLLAQSIPGGAGYAGIAGRPQGAAITAADRTGGIAQLSLGGPADLVRRARALLERRRLVVAALPPGAAGRASLDALVAAHRPGELLLVMQTPPGGTDAQLLPTGALGLDGAPAGRLTSQTTHTDGVIAGIDVAPTILEHLRLPVPDAVKGQPITSEPGRDAAALADLTERLRVVLPRRLPALWTLLGTWVALLLAAMLVADRRGTRWAFRVGPLAVLWLPSVLLLTAALAPGKTVELLLATGLALLAGAVTDRFAGWPRGPIVPAFAGLAAYAIDLAFGSPLIIQLAARAPTRCYGARFYGIGNELEATLSALLLIGHRRAARAVAGARAPPWRRSRAAVSRSALVVGAGRLGADVGGVITIGAGGGGRGRAACCPAA